MSDPITPLRRWPEGILQASVPANDNALRNEALSRSCRGVSNNVASPEDGEVYIVGDTPTGSFATFDPDDIALVRVTNGVPSWYAWAPADGVRLTMEDGSRKVYVGDSTSAWVDEASGGGVISVNGDTGAVTVLVPIIVACSDETTALTAGPAKVTFRMPYAFTLLAGGAGVRASLTTAQGSGSIFTVDINENGSSILSTKLTIDNTEKTSVTAATPPVISDTSLADDSEITIDIDQIGTSGATGLKVTLIGYPT